IGPHDSTAGRQRQRFNYTGVKYLMLQDTRVRLHGKARKPWHAQTSVTHELAHDEFVTTRRRSTGGVVLKAEGLIRQRSSEHRHITYGEDGAEWLGTGVIQNMLRRLLGLLKAQG